MLNPFFSSFNGLFLCKKVEKILESKPSSNLVYRDELNKKHPKNKKTPPKSLVEKTGLEDKEVKEVIRVKVKMTKQEAERLLSKCKEGGLLEFRHVANEIVNIPVDRVSVTTTSNGCYGGKAVLDSIPEEF